MEHLLQHLNPERFREWLSTRCRPRQTVGHRDAAVDTPVARFVRHTALETVWVTADPDGSRGEISDVHRRSAPLPAWAARFTALALQEPRNRISAARAMRLLQRACKEAS
jgi:hypothetical protein